MAELANIKDSALRKIGAAPVFQYQPEEDVVACVQEFLDTPPRVWTNEDFVSEEEFEKLDKSQKEFDEQMSFIKKIESDKPFMDSFWAEANNA